MSFVEKMSCPSCWIRTMAHGRGLASGKGSVVGCRNRGRQIQHVDNLCDPRPRDDRRDRSFLRKASSYTVGRQKDRARSLRRVRRARSAEARVTKGVRHRKPVPSAAEWDASKLFADPCAFWPRAQRVAVRVTTRVGHPDRSHRGCGSRCRARSRPR